MKISRVLIISLLMILQTSLAHALTTMWSLSSAGNTVTANHYISFGQGGAGDASNSKKRMVVAGNMSLRNLSISAAAAPGGGTGAIAYTVIVNGSASLLTCTMTDPATTCTDSTNTINLVRGDTVTLQATTAAGAPTYSSITGYVIKDISNTNRNDFIGCPAAATILSASATNYIGIGSNCSPNATEGGGLIPIIEQVSQFYVYLDGSAGAGASGKSYTVTLRKNQVDTAITCTILETATTCQDTINSITTAPGDILSVKVVPANTPTARYISVGVKLTSSIPGAFVVPSGAASPSVSAVHYSALSGGSTTSASTTTNNQLAPGNLYAMGFYAKATTAAPANGAGVQSWTFNLRDHTNSLTELTGCVISEAATTCSETFREALSASNFAVNYQLTPSGTPTTSTIRYGTLMTFNAPGTTTIKGY